MTNTFKKLFVAITGLSIAMAFPVNGNENCCNPPEPEYCPSPCCAPTCNPSPYCGPNCIPAPYCAEFNVYGEVLYWVPELGGLESAFGTTAIATSANSLGVLTTTITESDKEPDWKWSLGYRVGADLAFLCFDLEADWTHFKGKATFDEDGSSGKWNIRYDVIDLTFTRRFCIAPCFYFQPFRRAWRKDSSITKNGSCDPIFNSISHESSIFS